MWCAGLLYFALVTPLYSIMGVVESVLSRFKTLRKYRFWAYVFTCSCGIILSILFSFSGGILYLFANRFYGQPLQNAVTLLLINMGLLFVYSARRISDDFYYIYEKPLHNYWVTLWRCSPIFALVLVARTTKCYYITHFFSSPPYFCSLISIRLQPT